MRKTILIMSVFLSLSNASFADNLSEQRARFNAMTDQQIWDYAIWTRADLGGSTGPGVGKCFIGNQTYSVYTGVCSYYLRSTKYPSGNNGLPGVVNGSSHTTFSNGCLNSPNLPKVGGCFNDGYAGGNNYPSWNTTSTPICTTDHVKNAANTIRIAVNSPSDLCDLASLPPIITKKGSDTVQLLRTDKILFVNAIATKGKDCYNKSEGVPLDLSTGQTPSYIKFPEKVCKRLAKQAMQEFGISYFKALTETERTGIAIGTQMTAGSLASLRAQVYETVNASVLTQIQAKEQAYTAARLAVDVPLMQSIRTEIIALSGMMQEPSTEVFTQALRSELGLNRAIATEAQ